MNKDPRAETPGVECPCVAIIGGSGYSEFPALGECRNLEVSTPYGVVNEVVAGRFADVSVIFLPRHGIAHHVPPHLINYRANIWALHYLGVDNVVALNAVGGIRSDMAPGALVVPEQIIDYTFGRRHTFFEGGDVGLEHIDFTHPYDPQWRQALVETADSLGDTFIAGGVYACTQGPRLETAAEVRRLERDGADMVGMTGMPEAALARELNLNYACLAISVNWAAGVSQEPLSMPAIFQVLENVRQPIETFLENLLRSVTSSRNIGA